MTTIGELRELYSRTVEPRPSRFTDPAAYRAWATRADDWGASLCRMPECPTLSRAAECGDRDAAALLPMSEWAESRRHIMSPQTVAANHRLEWVHA